MESELLEALLRVNIAAAAAILAVIAMRAFIRREFGARAAYVLWLLVPVAALAVLAPPREVAFVAGAPAPRPAFIESPGDPALSAIATAAPAMPLSTEKPAAEKKAFSVSASHMLSLWLGGAAVYASLLALRQRRFMRRLGALRRHSGPLFRAEAPGIGPAMIGAFRPRIILPSDFEARFHAMERRLILAHERMHIAAGDGIANVAVAAAQALCWFNPLVHAAARLIRDDQELACDAAVMARFPGARRVYAEALVKSQKLFCSVPLGNAWPARAQHPLAQRIINLAQVASAPRRLAGFAAVAMLAAIAAAAAWAAQPPVIISKPAENILADAPAGPASEEIVLADADKAESRARLSREDLAREAALRSAKPLGASNIYAATGITLDEIAAVLTVIPEDRSDIAVEYNAGKALPQPRTYLVEDTLVIDGGLNLDDDPCTERFAGGGVAKLPNVGNIPARDLPRLVIRTPRMLDVTVGGAVLATIGPSAGGYVANHGCGDTTVATATAPLTVALGGYGDVEIADMRDPLKADLYGLGSMRIGRTGDAEFNLIGVGHIDAKASSGKVKGFLQGIGNISIASIAGGASLELPGAGDFEIGAVSGPFSFRSGGAGNATIASLNAPQADVSSWGASKLDIAAGKVDVFNVTLGGASKARFGGKAGAVRAVFSDSGGDFEVGEAGDVDQVRNGVAAGSVKITG